MLHVIAPGLEGAGLRRGQRNGFGRLGAGVALADVNRGASGRGGFAYQIGDGGKIAIAKTRIQRTRKHRR